jgi:transposase-like protein
MLADAPYFYDEDEAYRFIERQFWPNGPECPRCRAAGRVGKLNGRTTRAGLYKCYDCGKPFTVKIGTIFERSHLPLHVWLKAIFLIATSKKEIDARELHELLEITPKTAGAVMVRLEQLKHLQIE